MAYMTHFLKHLLRKRNRLSRRVRHEAAAVIADRINRIIVKTNATSFDGLCRGSKKLWFEVNRPRNGRNSNTDQSANHINSENLNQHYRDNISIDYQYHFCDTGESNDVTNV